MKSFFDKLTPPERRLVVFVGIAVFVVINIWFIIPMFGQYGEFEAKRAKALKQIVDYKVEIARKGAYEKLIKELSNVADIASEAAALRLFDEVHSQATLSGINANSISPLSRGSDRGKTNTFFEEASVVVNYSSGEKELVDFLYRLADKEFLIRAKSLEVQPEPPGRMRLMGRITLVKSYQRKPPPKATPTVPKSAPATNTATKPTTKTPPLPRSTPAATNATTVMPQKK